MSDLLNTLSNVSQEKVKTSPWDLFLDTLDKNPKMPEREVMGLFSKTLSKSSSTWKDSHGNTLLMHMASRGQLGVVKRLIHELYADVKALSENKETALHKAARGGYQAICEELIASGINVSQKNINNDTASAIAKEAGHADVANYLKGKETSKSIFMSANGYSFQ